VTGLFVGFLGSLMAAAGIGYAMVGVPNEADAAKAQNNVFYWSNGKQMVATGGEINRQIIGYDQIPKEMRYAVMSAENKTFETDRGVDATHLHRHRGESRHAQDEHDDQGSHRERRLDGDTAG